MVPRTAPTCVIGWVPLAVAHGRSPNRCLRSRWHPRRHGARPDQRAQFRSRPRGPAASTSEITRLTEDFIGYYADHIADASRPFDGLENALDELATRGCRLAVCTNKLEWLSKLLLDRLGLSSRFSAICGADTFGVAKPDPAILQQTIARAGGNISSAIMVGDAGTDIGVARRAGVPVIGVEFGYTDVPIAELKPDRLIRHMSELREAVESLAVYRNLSI